MEHAGKLLGVAFVEPVEVVLDGGLDGANVLVHATLLRNGIRFSRDGALDASLTRSS